MNILCGVARRREKIKRVGEWLIRPGLPEKEVSRQWSFPITYKGLAGEESGEMGSKPHYHYLSDKSGITWEDLMKGIKDCDMPTSKVHIVINR